jgi:hypothetical protein
VPIDGCQRDGIDDPFGPAAEHRQWQRRITSDGPMDCARHLGQDQLAGSALTLYVEAFNSAHRLYGRLGFRAVGGHGVYELLEWRRPAAS